MIAIKLKSMLICGHNFVSRNLRSRRLGPANPGLDHRVKAFEQEGLQIVDDDAEEFMENSNSDFFRVNESFDHHLKDRETTKDQLRSHIVKQKYFNDNYPNLLTWSEKEQIRHLAQSEPNEWTCEKIEESFPVTSSVAKKLLKYKWQPATEQRIARHDENVMRNWKELKENTLNISPKLRERFLKFSERTIPPLNKKSIKHDLTKEKQIGEFESIVNRCAENIKINQKTDNQNQTEDDDSEINNPIKKSDTKRLTLSELTERIKKQVNDGNEIEMTDQMIVDSVSVRSLKGKPSQSIEAVVDNRSNVELSVGNNTEVATFSKDVDEKSIMDYPERIRIPSKLFKKGATYKVNDCYYDYDGRFLYRVLGMDK